jgi:hypothetical protein
MNDTLQKQQGELRDRLRRDQAQRDQQQRSQKVLQKMNDDARRLRELGEQDLRRRRSRTKVEPATIVGPAPEADGAKSSITQLSPNQPTSRRKGRVLTVLGLTLTVLSLLGFMMHVNGLFVFALLIMAILMFVVRILRR